VDPQTIAIYDECAAAIAARHGGSEFVGFYDLARRYFHQAAPTADIGCGSGRYAAWLVDHGYPVVGYEASEGMRAQARTLFPALDVRPAFLPELAAIADASYTNLVCMAVLMHLPQSEHSRAITGLARILRPGGRLIVTWRSSAVADEREADGRLFSELPLSDAAICFNRAGIRLLHQEEQSDPARSRVRWRSVVGAKD
jgi:SAM-dependent methyltransferase